MKDLAKTDRHRLLKNLIGEEEIHDQVQLQERLHHLGVEVTQATISRDLQEMGVTKVRIKPGVFKYTILEQLPQNYLMDQLRVLFNNFVYALKSTGNLLLVKTSPGNANGVASLVDRIAFPGVLGTVAGDDTVLVVLDNAKNCRGLV
jgi:transcriptional regulator of arginine metabolism